MIKVTVVALFFSEDISYVVRELKKREELREFLRMKYVPDAAYISRFLGSNRNSIMASGMQLIPVITLRFMSIRNRSKEY